MNTHKHNKKRIHIDFEVIPTPGQGWGELDVVNISIPKHKFKNIAQVKSIWLQQTGNVARHITQGVEQEVA